MAETANKSRPAQGNRQVVMTVVYGAHAEKLDRTFISFAQNKAVELHAFVVGDRLPANPLPAIHYHLKPPDPQFGHPMRDADFRRWLFVDELNADYALVVDGYDALCLQPLPAIAELLDGAWLGASVEHSGGRYLAGKLYTSNFVNAGVTFWDVRASRQLRQEVNERGRTRFRNLVDDQLCLNEVVHTRYFDRIRILPCQYNFRGYVGKRQRGWPTVEHLDGVKIYHNGYCIEAAKTLMPVKAKADLPPLEPDREPVGKWQQRWRRFQCRWEKQG
jgi:hypothetical protein